MRAYPFPVEPAIVAEVQRLQGQYEAFMTAQGELPDLAQLRTWAIENLKEQIIIEEEAKAASLPVAELLHSITQKLPKVTVAEARAFFKGHPEQFIAPERVHACHLVLHRDAYSAAEAVQTLLNLRAQLLSGALTWEAAVANASSCANQSDLGFFPRGAMVQEFEEAAFAAAEGSLTDVVETPFGWHLIRVIAHLPEEPMLFEEAREALLKTLQEERERTALEHFVDERKGGFAE
ncbi:MAG: peptidylprolyl isomerase [Kiritimatiellia bacterium]